MRQAEQQLAMIVHTADALPLSLPTQNWKSIEARIAIDGDHHQQPQSK